MSAELVLDLAALRALALEIAHEAVALARVMRTGGIDVAATKSSAVDVVTAADRACEDLIRARILAARPDDAIMGEEGVDQPGTTGVRWIVDPIDGTVNYLYGLPDWAVSIAAEVDGEIAVGVVVNGSTDVAYAAVRGTGATRDDQPIAVRPTPPLAERLVLTGFGYEAAVRTHQAACVAALLPHVRDIRRMGSCALDLCHVADGSGDAYVEEGPRPWDHSAGGLVLTEAGGRFGLVAGRLHEVVPGAPEQALVVGTPAEGWDTFLDALGEAGFLAPGARE